MIVFVPHIAEHEAADAGDGTEDDGEQGDMLLVDGGHGSHRLSVRDFGVGLGRVRGLSFGKLHDVNNVCSGNTLMLQLDRWEIYSGAQNSRKEGRGKAGVLFKVDG
jgi:hypothetical protein